MGQVRAGGVRQDLLDDGGHHSLIVAVPAARAIGRRDPKNGKKRTLAQLPELRLPHPPVPGSFLLHPYCSSWEEVGLSHPMGLGTGTE